MGEDAQAGLSPRSRWIFDFFIEIFTFYILVIDTKKEGLKEVYVISDYENPKSPVIIHFILVNDTFRKFSSPDVPRAVGRVCFWVWYLV